MARKRPLLFVDTIAEMRARAPDLRLAAPLFGEDRQDLSEAIRARALARGVADCVHIMGFRYPPEQWLAGCEVLLVPAVDEPFGRTLIEAMLLGTVVVAAASGGNPEAIRMVSPAASCRRTMRPRSRSGRSLCSPLRALTTSLADAARQDALGRFGLREHAEAIMRVYDTMLSAGPAAAGAPGGAESARSPDQNRGLPDEGSRDAALAAGHAVRCGRARTDRRIEPAGSAGWRPVRSSLCLPAPHAFCRPAAALP